MCRSPIGAQKLEKLERFENWIWPAFVIQRITVLAALLGREGNLHISLRAHEQNKLLQSFSFLNRFNLCGSTPMVEAEGRVSSRR